MPDILKSITSGYIIMSRTVENNPPELQSIFEAHFQGDKENLKYIQDAKTMEELFGLLGMEIENNLEIDNGQCRYSVTVHTGYVDQLYLVFKDLRDKGLIKFCYIPCWESNICNTYYVVDGEESHPTPKHFLVAEFTVSGNIKYIYEVDGKLIASDVEGQYEGAPFSEKDIIEEVDSVWSLDSVGYSIHTDYPNLFFRCEYSLPVYDGIEISIYGYGDTPEDALKNVRDREEHIRDIAMKKYKYVSSRDSS